MKIAIVCYPTLGGGCVIASELALGLSERGHEVHVVSYDIPFRLRHIQHNILIHRAVPLSHPLLKYPPYTLAVAEKLVEIYKKFGLDIIHVHFAIPHAISSYLAQKILGERKVRTVTTLHGTDVALAGARAALREVMKYIIFGSDGVTLVSKYLRKQMNYELGLKRDVRLIYNFTDIQKCAKSAKHGLREKYASGGEKIFIHASNFRAVKRVSDVVRIFAKVQKKISSKLLFVGDGPEKIFVKQTVKNLCLGKSVLFLGVHQSIEHILKCSDIMLLPSEQESFGLAALEANACGVPVIGTRVGGLPEVVTHGKTGFLFPVGEISGMAQKSLELLENKKLYAAISENGKTRAKKYFDKNLIIPKYEEYYRELLKRKG